MDKLDFNFVATTVLKGVIRNNDFDRLISSDLDLATRSLKI